MHDLNDLTNALKEKNIQLASSIAQELNTDLLAETFCARIPRGEGRVHLKRIPYFAEHAIEFLSPYDLIILIGSKDFKKPIIDTNFS